MLKIATGLVILPFFFFKVINEELDLVTHQELLPAHTIEVNILKYSVNKPFSKSDLKIVIFYLFYIHRPYAPMPLETLVARLLLFSFLKRIESASKKAELVLSFTWEI